MSQNLHKSLHLTHTTSDEWDTQGTLHTEGVIDIKDFEKKIEKLKEKWDESRFDRFERIVKILITLITGFSAGTIIAYAGLKLSLPLENNTNNQQIIDNAKTELQGYVDRAAQASGIRQEVLTEYSTRISDLRLEKLSDSSLRNVLRGEILIALRRLDDKNEIRDYIDRTQDIEAELSNLVKPPTSDINKATSQEKDLSEAEDAQINNNILNSQIASNVLYGFNDSGELKGLLVRFLFESDLLTRDNQIVDLSGANITRVNLNYAPLPDVDLKGAWLTWGTFLNTDLRRANLSRTDLKGADLQGANLTDANLEKADLRGAKLQGIILDGSKLNLKDACFDENTSIDSKHKASMRDATGEDLAVPCKDLT